MENLRNLSLNPKYAYVHWRRVRNMMPKAILVDEDVCGLLDIDGMRKMKTMHSEEEVKSNNHRN